MERCVDRSLEGGEKIYYGSVTRPVEKRISNNFPPHSIPRQPTFASSLDSVQFAFEENRSFASNSFLRRISMFIRERGKFESRV